MDSKSQKSKTIFRRHLQHPAEQNRAVEPRKWLNRFDDLIEEVDGLAEFLIEIEEEPNFGCVPS
jgi:hypothetical protein